MCSYSLDSLDLLKNFTMPNPLTFKEEGGASLSPDGSTFLAVRTYIDRNLAKKHS